MEIINYDIGDRVSWKDPGVRATEGEIIAIHKGEAWIYYLTWDHTFTHTSRSFDQLRPVRSESPIMNVLALTRIENKKGVHYRVLIESNSNGTQFAATFEGAETPPSYEDIMARYKDPKHPWKEV